MVEQIFQHTAVKNMSETVLFCFENTSFLHCAFNLHANHLFFRLKYEFLSILLTKSVCLCRLFVLHAFEFLIFILFLKFK